MIGDVGQDRQEEIDFAGRGRGRGAGANYGWSAFEGDLPYKPRSAPRTIAPEIVANHSDGYCAIIGDTRGRVYVVSLAGPIYRIAQR